VLIRGCRASGNCIEDYLEKGENFVLCRLVTDYSFHILHCIAEGHQWEVREKSQNIYKKLKDSDRLLIKKSNMKSSRKASKSFEKLLKSSREKLN
jgi:hypothetical protein